MRTIPSPTKKTAMPADLDPDLLSLDDDAAVLAAFPLMRELRPHVTSADELLARVARMRRQGYRILGARDKGQLVALAGYRLQENLVYGPFLYVDDLVVTGDSRGGRWGARLLDALAHQGRREGALRLVLDTGLANSLAQRFYFRQGLLTSAIRLDRPLAAR